MNQSELVANTFSRRQAQETAYRQVTIGISFTSDWLRKWREIFKPITKFSSFFFLESLIIRSSQLVTLRYPSFFAFYETFLRQTYKLRALRDRRCYTEFLSAGWWSRCKHGGQNDLERFPARKAAIFCGTTKQGKSAQVTNLGLYTVYSEGIILEAIRLRLKTQYWPLCFTRLCYCLCLHRSEASTVFRGFAFRAASIQLR